MVHMHYYELRCAHLRLGPLLLMRKHCLLASAANLQLTAKLFPGWWPHQKAVVWAGLSACQVSTSENTVNRQRATEFKPTGILTKVCLKHLNKTSENCVKLLKKV